MSETPKGAPFDTKPCERCRAPVDLFEDGYPPIATLCDACIQIIDAQEAAMMTERDDS